VEAALHAQVCEPVLAILHITNQPSIPHPTS
jgi:hypothetical protein